MDASEGGLPAPMYRLVARPLCCTLISDVSKHAVGGFCLETGQYWRYDLSEARSFLWKQQAPSVVG